MFFLHESHASRALDLLFPAFLAFPDRDFLALTFARDSLPTFRIADLVTHVPAQPNANPFQVLTAIKNE